jgi:lipid-binding SYLF domain-containing protein
MKIRLSRMWTAATFSLGVALTLTPTLVAAPVQADEASEINAEAQQALQRFKDKVKNASDVLARAEGVLVFPEVKKVGLVAGAQWGKGALYVGQKLNKPVANYRMDAGSVGLQAGYREADFVFVFFTKEALEDFRDGPEWSAGAEAGLTLADENWDGSVDTLARETPIVAFVFDEDGLMGDVSVSGIRFARYTPEKGKR